jgi:hypothetical protein
MVVVELLKARSEEYGSHKNKKTWIRLERSNNVALVIVLANGKEILHSVEILLKGPVVVRDYLCHEHHIRELINSREPVSR